MNRTKTLASNNHKNIFQAKDIKKESPITSELFKNFFFFNVIANKKGESDRKRSFGNGLIL